MLDAAARLFGSYRFHEVRMEDIAAEAAVGKGTLYRYFSDKEELYLALLDRASRQLMHRLEGSSVRTGPARLRLTAVVNGILAFFDDHPNLLDLIQRAEVLRGSGPEFPWHETRTEILHLVLDIFKEGKARDEFCIRDAETSAMMLLGGLRSVIRFGKQPRPRDLAARIVEAFLQGADVSGRCRRPASDN